MTPRYRLILPAAFGLAAMLTPGVAGAAATELTISHSQKTADFLPLWIAEDAGYFKKRNLDVAIRYLPAQQGIPALIAGQTQVAGIGAADAASAEAQGTKLKLVATLTPTHTFQFWARPDHATAAALKGQRVGITSTTGSLYVGTLLALKRLGLKPSDVALTPLGGVTNVNNSLLAGSIAAAASHPPPTYQFKRAGFVELVDLAKEKIPSVSAGIWITQSYLDENRDTVQKVVDAIVEAIKREKSDKAYAESEMSKHLGVSDKAELDFTYDFYVNEVMADGPMPQAEQIKSNIDVLSANNPKLKSVDAQTMIDQSLMENAEKQKATDAGGTSPK